MKSSRFIPFFQLLQWRAAAKLESVGMRHSSGRSVTAMVKKVFGLDRKMKSDDVSRFLDKIIKTERAKWSKPS